MTTTERHKIELAENGFTTVGCVYSDQEIEQILRTIDQADKTKQLLYRFSNY